MNKVFDNEKYLKMQKEKILERVEKYNNKLYLELGGKLFDDYHATRVLPGIESDVKIKLIDSLKEKAELIICVNSQNIQDGRIRSDYNTLYEEDCIRLINIYRKLGFLVSGVALTVFNNQKKAVRFANKLKKMNEKVYYLGMIKDYPNNYDYVIESFEKNDFIETTRPLVIMTSSGSASGKLSACLSQIYNEYKRGNKVGYSKYDIFPIWNLPINHPLNLAFEAATADIGDKIMIDKYYYEKYNKNVSNYNRDLDVFPIIRNILNLVSKDDAFSSPTEMVVNTMKDAILDNEMVCKLGKAEVCRRYFTYCKQFLRGDCTKDTIYRVKEIMNENNITINDFELVKNAREIFREKKIYNKMIVLKLENSKIIYATESEKYSCNVNLLLKVIENIFNINIDKLLLYSKKSKININELIEYININHILNIDELKKVLYGSYAHASTLISKEEENELRSLGIFVTCEINEEIL